MKTIDPPVIVSATYNCKTNQLWKALTELSEMKKWYFDNIPDFKAIKGFKTKFLISNEGRNFTHNWEVTNIDPGKMIQYTWTFDEHPGQSYSKFDISKLTDSKSLLSVTSVVLENYPEGIPEFKRESCEGGWNYFLNDRLNSYFSE